MRSSTPKMLHPVCGRAMVAWPILAAREAGAGRVAAIVSPGRDISAGLPEGVETVEQPRARRHRRRDPRGAAADRGGRDRPRPLRRRAADLDRRRSPALLDAHAASAAAATMLTIELDDPGAYGRVVRTDDGEVEKVVEAKAAGDADAAQLAIREINAGTYAFDAAPLAAALAGLSNDNAQGEYYLPDVFTGAARRRPRGRRPPRRRPRGDDGGQQPGRPRRGRGRGAPPPARGPHARRGDRSSTPPRPGSTPASRSARTRGSSPAPACAARPRSAPAPWSARTRPLIDTEIGVEATVLRSHLDTCKVGDGASVGPFAYLRPGTVLDAGAKAGAFVEIKNSHIGKGAKVPHLSYVGDADIGAGSEPRRGHDHRQLRRFHARTGRRSGATCGSASTRC